MTDVEIDNLIVHPDHRSGGIGSALFRYIEDYARRQGARCLTLHSYAANRASHRLYYRQDFEIWSFHFVKPVGNIHA